MEHQIHFGKKFYQEKKTGYWMSTTKPKIRAHQWVWKNSHGEIPKGYHIHHVNENKSDNRIENLELIKAARHVRFHMKEKMLNPLEKEKAINNLNKCRELSKKWHASKQGIAWHSYHAIKNNFGNWEPIEKTCDNCNTKYLTKKKSERGNNFCTNACKSAYRRKHKIDFISKNCQFCGKEFHSNKYDKVRFCSRSCGKRKI